MYKLVKLTHECNYLFPDLKPATADKLYEKFPAADQFPICLLYTSDWKELEFNYQPDMFSNDKMTFVAKREDMK